MDTIIAVRYLPPKPPQPCQYWVTFSREDGTHYSEQRSAIPTGWEEKVDYGHSVPPKE